LEINRLNYLCNRLEDGISVAPDTIADSCGTVSGVSCKFFLPHPKKNALFHFFVLNLPLTFSIPNFAPQ